MKSKSKPASRAKSSVKPPVKPAAKPSPRSLKKSFLEGAEAPSDPSRSPSRQPALGLERARVAAPSGGPESVRGWIQQVLAPEFGPAASRRIAGSIPLEVLKSIKASRKG